MISAYQSALSGLQAFGTKLHSNANNVANGSTEAFKRTRVLLSDAKPQGVRLHVDTVSTPGNTMPEQTNNNSEPIELSNVDLAQELTEMGLNALFYKANLRTIQATDEMFGNLLDLKA